MGQMYCSGMSMVPVNIYPRCTSCRNMNTQIRVLAADMRMRQRRHALQEHKKLKQQQTN